MIDKNPLSRTETRDKRQRFSIRKFNVGVASVAVVAFFMVNGASVAADSLDSPALDTVEVAEPAEELAVAEEAPALLESVADEVVEEMAEQAGDVAPAVDEDIEERIVEQERALIKNSQSLVTVEEHLSQLTSQPADLSASQTDIIDVISSHIAQTTEKAEIVQKQIDTITNQQKAIGKTVEEIELDVSSKEKIYRDLDNRYQAEQLALDANATKISKLLLEKERLEAAQQEARDFVKANPNISLYSNLTDYNGNDYFEVYDEDRILSDIEYQRIIYKTLEAELEDSRAYFEETGQTAIVRRAADIYEAYYSDFSRRSWNVASVTYSGSERVEQEFVKNYKPDMKKVSEYALDYIKELRRINNISFEGIRVTDDAINYAQFRAEEIATDRIPDKSDIHSTNKLTTEADLPKLYENVARSSTPLQYINDQFIHSDKEFAYYYLLQWFAEYSNTQSNFEHAQNLFSSNNVAFGMGQNGHAVTFEITQDKNSDGNKTEPTLSTSTTDHQGFIEKLEGIGNTKKYIDGRLEFVKSYSREYQEFTKDNVTVRKILYNRIDENGEIKNWTVYLLDPSDEYETDRTIWWTSTSDGKGVSVLSYKDIEDLGTVYGATWSTLHPDREPSQSSHTLYITDDDEVKFHVSNGSPYKFEFVSSENEQKTVEFTLNPNYSSVRTLSEVIKFLPSTTFIYSVEPEVFEETLKDIEEQIVQVRRLVSSLVSHSKSPIVRRLEEIGRELEKLGVNPTVTKEQVAQAHTNWKNSQDTLKNVKNLNNKLSNFEKQSNALHQKINLLEEREDILYNLKSLISLKELLTPITSEEYRELPNSAGVGLYEVTTVNGREVDVVLVESFENTSQEEEIAFTTVYEDDPTLYEGTEKVKTAGVNGKKTLITTYQLQDGKVVATKAEKVTQAAINRVVVRGTKPSPTPVTVTEYRPTENGVAEYQVTKLEGQVTGEKLVKTYTNSVETQDIAFATKEEADATLLEGTRQTKQAGVDGSRLTGTIHTVVDGQLKTETVDKIVTEPVSEIVLVGTRQPVRTTQTSYRATETGVEEYATDYVDDVQSGQPRLVKTYTNAQAEVISFEKVQEEDTSLPVGETKVKQVGANGSRRVGNLYSVEKGQLKITEVNEVTAATPEITLVGTRQPVRTTQTSYRAIETGVEEYETDYVDGVASGSSRLVKTHTNATPTVIAFETIKEDDATLLVGDTKVKQSGVDGSRLIGTIYTVVDGQLKTETVDKIVTEPVSEIILVGTRQPVRTTQTSYRAIETGVEEYETDYVDGVASGSFRLVKTYTNATPTAIAFETIKEDDATLLVGDTKVKQSGVNGSRLIGTIYTVVDGQLKTETVDKIVTEPVSEIVLVGTRQPVRKTETSYRAIETGVEEYETDYIDGVASGSSRLVKTYTNATPTATAFETIKEDDATLLIGDTKVKQSGVNGSRLTGTIYTVVDGQLKTETVDKIVTEPVSEIILVGTKPAPQAQVTKVLRQTETGAEEVEVTTLDGVVTEKILATYTNSRQETTLSYETVRQEDDSLTVGEEVVKQPGKAGSRVTGVTYTVVDGKLVTTNLDQIVQEPVAEIILVGTKGEEIFAIPDVAPEADELPEYVFDPADFQDVLKPESSEEIETEVQPEPSEQPVVEEIQEPSEEIEPEVKPETSMEEMPEISEESATEAEPEISEEVIQEVQPEPSEETVTETDLTPTAFSRYAGVWVNGRGQRFTISEDGTFTGYFNENQVEIFSISDQGVVTFTNGGPSVVLPSYLPAGYGDAMTVNSDNSLERFVFFGDASSIAYMELLADDFFYRLGAVPSLSTGNGGANTANGAGVAAGAATLTGRADDVAAVRPASLTSGSEATTAQTATSLPNTGEATSLVALLGASMLTTAGASIKLRRR